MRIISLIICAVVAPCAACSSSNDEGTEFSFGATEMQAAAGGDWVGTMTLGGAAQTNYQMHLDYAPAHTHPACESRTLVGPECTATTSMGFVGVLSSDDAKFAQTPITANFWVWGEKLQGGILSIQASAYGLNANYTDGVFVEGNADQDGTPAGSFTMQRP